MTILARCRDMVDDAAGPSLLRMEIHGNLYVSEAGIKLAIASANHYTNTCEHGGGAYAMVINELLVKSR